MKQHFPKILAILLACIWLVAGCESDSGTYQTGPSGDSDSLTEEPTNLSFHTLGNGSTDGNPAIVVLGWDAFVPVWAGAQPTVWTSVKLSLRGLALYNEDDGTTESFTFDSPKTFELFDTGDIRLKAFLPTEGSYSALSLILEGQDGKAPFIASGTRNDSPVTIQTNLNGAISLKRTSGAWTWEEGEEEAFVVAMNLANLNGAVDWTNLEPLQDGSYFIDAYSDEMQEKAITESFLLVSDVNDNGQADDEETGEDNTLAQGDTAVYTICLPWEPDCYCDESGCRVISVGDSSFFVELLWDQGNETDFDLILTRYADNGTFGYIEETPFPYSFGLSEEDVSWDERSEDTCNFGNRTANWGDPDTSLDDAVLFIDNVDGWGPEVINFPNPTPGKYRIVVRFFSDTNDSVTEQNPATATVNVYVNGQLTQQWQQIFTSDGVLWKVADVVWTNEENVTFETIPLSETGSFPNPLESDGSICR